MKLYKLSLPLTLLIMSAPSSAYSFQFNAGVDTNKSFAAGIEGLVYDNYVLGAQINLSTTDNYETGPYNEGVISNGTYTKKRSSQLGTLYVGYQFSDTMLEGLSLKLGVTQMVLDMSADAYGTVGSETVGAEIYQLTERKYLPFLGFGYPINERLVFNVHASFAGIETVNIDGEQEPTGLDATTVSFLLGFRF
ncbi:hypothetical protein MD535_14580 [Vibrio sp. ZSDZ65]|uniref:Outer membrane protein beta-barrel domain-containing protein n=1 Tax=Vibrio qingdaonensis TaxID=2829491 RepID=A0A9X3CQJ9_9VIBR|nr:hypothetical protein [Vibrio qingdaonensis]MCW8347229.1 hypothetical protein [Vibrio qingdaonensis]